MYLATPVKADPSELAITYDCGWNWDTVNVTDKNSFVNGAPRRFLACVVFRNYVSDIDKNDLHWPQNRIDECLAVWSPRYSKA